MTINEPRCAEKTAAASEPVPSRPARGRLEISYRLLDQLKPSPDNPRRHDKRQLQALTRNIKKLGFRVPILIDRADRIIAGHGRWEAARLAGLTEIPTILIDDLTEAEIKAFMIADNRIAELASWDDSALGRQLIELSRLAPDLSLELTGFEMGEIDFRIESMTQARAEEPDPADVIPSDNKPPVTKRGDLWLVGGHRILCADSLDEKSYARLMAGERAAAAITDPPYNVKIDGHASGLGKTRHREFAMAAGEMSEAEYAQFLTRASRLLGTHSATGALLYISIDWRHVRVALNAARALRYRLVNLCVWVKHNGGMGSLYRSRHELVLVLKRGKEQHVNNVQLGRFGRNRTNVWEYRGANDFGRGEGEGDLLALHPTPKPVAMIADAILDCTARSDIVLDAFLGSGTTLIAAERTGRRCFGLELDPGYVDIAIRRWQRLTSQPARHGETGLTFDEITDCAEKADV